MKIDLWSRSWAEPKRRKKVLSPPAPLQSFFSLLSLTKSFPLLMAFDCFFSWLLFQQTLLTVIKWQIEGCLGNRWHRYIQSGAACTSLVIIREVSSFCSIVPGTGFWFRNIFLLNQFPYLPVKKDKILYAYLYLSFEDKSLVLYYF